MERESKPLAAWTSIEKIVSSSARVRRSASMILRSRALYLHDADPVVVQIHEVRATCSCGASEFYAIDPEPYGPEAELVCAACRKQQPYVALLDRIGEEAMRRARESLAQLRREVGSASSD